MKQTHIPYKALLSFIFCLIILPIQMGGCLDGSGGEMSAADAMKVVFAMGMNSPFELYVANILIKERERLSEKQQDYGKLTDAEKETLDKINAWYKKMDAVWEKNQKERRGWDKEKYQKELAKFLGRKEKPGDANRPTPWGSDSQPWSPSRLPAGTTFTSTGLPCGAVPVSVRIGNTWYSSHGAPNIPSDWASRANEVWYSYQGQQYHVSPWMPTLPTTGNPRAQNFTPPNQGLIKNNGR